MDNKTTISITEGRNKIFKIAKQVQNPETRYTLTENGKPKVVVMSSDEFESWKETIDTLEENPDLRKEVKEADEEHKKGQTCSLDDFLAQKGFIKAKQNV